MHLLSVQNLSKHYGAKTLFSDVAFHINAGQRIGIVGVNGSGKTTLLNILAGRETADSGTVNPNPQTRLEYLPQNPVMGDEISALDYLFQGNSPTMRLLRAYENALIALEKEPANPARQAEMTALNHKMDVENGWAAEANVKAVLSRLGISDFETPLGQLSGGQRRRVALARALIDPADLLILDEPTNHIDPPTIIWLEDYLLNIKSAILMVTHDRYFLDRIASVIFELERGQMHVHPGNYSRFLETKAHREATQQKQALEKRQFLQKELEWLNRTPMARGGKQKARIQRAEALLNEEQATSTGSLNISAASRRTGKQILEIKGLSKTFNDKTVIQNFSYTVKKGDRLGIIGPNGSGKSTLLNLIAGRLEPDSGEINFGATIHLGYYDQESAALDENQRVFDNISEIARVVNTASGDSISAAQMLERFQFSRQAQQAYIKTLSGGERRRLYLLRTLMLAPNLLLLDEPTNDLDIQTLSILEDYLDSFDGVLIVASHDRYFLDRTVSHIFAFEGEGIIAQYPGNYSAYHSQKAARQTAESPELAPKKETSPANKAPSTRPPKLSYKQQQELAQLEDRIPQLEAKIESLSAEINLAGSDFERLQTLSAALTQRQTELETAIERWAELAELAEQG